MKALDEAERKDTLGRINKVYEQVSAT